MQCLGNQDNQAILAGLKESPSGLQLRSSVPWRKTMVSDFEIVPRSSLTSLPLASLGRFNFLPKG